LGRRVEKRVYDNDTSTETLARRYLYDGFNIIAETDTSNNLQRTFTWGLDLAGSFTTSDGVGALLQIDDIAAGKVLSAIYDGNGNVASLVNASGNLEAIYEYDPSGNLLRCEGTYAKNNPFRFSTKWQDDETGLINYGVRYYSSCLGRFINRYPIAEKGGLNLYGFCGNDGVDHYDYLGQSWLSRLLKFTRKATRDVLNIATLGTLKSPINHLYEWGENHQQELKIAAAIIASIYTFGAASGWASAEMTSSIANSAYLAAGNPIAGMVAGSSAVAAAGTEIGVVSGLVGGAAAGAVSGLIMTGTIQGTLKGAASGAIMGGIGGYYGNSWNLGRVGVSAVGGGLSSKINGGSFKQGFQLSGAIAFITDVAYNMRVAQVQNSKIDSRNSSGRSIGFFGDAFKLGGGRFDERGDAIQVESPLGGVQGGQGVIKLPFIGRIQYTPNSSLDHVVEAYAGVHDWLNSWWGYNPNTGNYNPGLSFFGSKLGTSASGFANVMNWVDVPLATPIVVTSVGGVYLPSTVSLTIQSSHRD
jgi:RHS repeat-associated protein